ncbi:MAG: thymidylate synthase ThyX, partial [Oscillospiraceae bacterium]|nr:thymidylate synthase ThyX [Oscillospiraceae bacterium]
MINWTEYTDVWPKVKRAARTTISREGEGAYPTDSWKKTILLAEHSPIRKIKFSWKWHGLKSWVSVHFVRHFQGILHWVSTQRTDRTGVDRDNSPQNTPVDHECEANAQALINISRR